MIQWKKIKEFNDYLISSNGKCFSLKTNKLLKVQQYSNEYLFYSFKINGVQHTRSVHHLLGIAFIPNPENKPTVNHKNHIRTDNRLENLEWATYPEQCDEIWKERASKARRTEKNINISINNFRIASDKNKKPTYQYSLDGELVGVYSSVKDAAEAVGAFPQNISQCIKGKTKTVKGYKWSDNPM